MHNNTKYLPKIKIKTINTKKNYTQKNIIIVVQFNYIFIFFHIRKAVPIIKENLFNNI